MPERDESEASPARLDFTKCGGESRVVPGPDAEQSGANQRVDLGPPCPPDSSPNQRSTGGQVGRTASGSTRAAAETSLRAALQRYAAVCGLVEAGRALVGPSDTEAPLIEGARLAVVAWLDACIAWGATESELDAICAEEART